RYGSSVCFLVRREGRGRVPPAVDAIALRPGGGFLGVSLLTRSVEPGCAGGRLSMRFGLFYEHQMARPWAEGAEEQLLLAAMELGGFRIDRSLKHAQWEEALDAVTRMMVEEPFAGYQGKFISMPRRNVVPKPKQKPHPPLWMACSRRETIRIAARKGIGALSF